MKHEIAVFHQTGGGTENIDPNRGVVTTCTCSTMMFGANEEESLRMFEEHQRDPRWIEGPGSIGVFRFNP